MWRRVAGVLSGLGLFGWSMDRWMRDGQRFVHRRVTRVLGVDRSPLSCRVAREREKYGWVGLSGWSTGNAQLGGGGGL